MTFNRLSIRQELFKIEHQSVVSQLAASIAHEVRNPLTVVKGFVQLFKENKVSADKRDDSIARFTLCTAPSG